MPVVSNFLDISWKKCKKIKKHFKKLFNNLIDRFVNIKIKKSDELIKMLKTIPFNNHFLT